MSWYKTAENLSKLSMYLSTRRQIGHTRSIMVGLNNVDTCFLLVSNRRQRDYIEGIKKSHIIPVSLDEIDKLRGVSYPLAVDAWALQNIIWEFNIALDELREENALLKSDIKAYKELLENKQEKADAKSKQVVRQL